MTAWFFAQSERAALQVGTDLGVEFHALPDSEWRRLPIAGFQPHLGGGSHRPVGGHRHPEGRMRILVRSRSNAPAWSRGCRPATLDQRQATGERKQCPERERCSWIPGGQNTRWTRSCGLSRPFPGTAPGSPCPCGGPRWGETAAPRMARCRVQSLLRGGLRSCCPV